jgi:hypothetical protein
MDERHLHVLSLPWSRVGSTTLFARIPTRRTVHV